jgi:hypothetical protein
MVTFGRKAAEEGPASTAALSRVAISQSQRRALRHSAGAPIKPKSSAAELKRKIWEEVMNGTFSNHAVRAKISSRTKLVSMRIAGGILAGILAVAIPAAYATGTGAAGTGKPVDVSRGVDRAKVETLQRWVNAGHEEWCKDARLVAMDEMKRLAPAFAGSAGDLEALPLDTESADAERAVFVWSSPDGTSTYRVTVERFGWLLQLAGEPNSIVWVPTHAEVVAHR